MTDSRRLPEQRAKRRIVIVLDDADIEQLRADPGSSELWRRQDTAIVDAGVDAASADPITASLERQGLLVNGTVLVASPYRDGDYASLEGASERFGLEKWAAVSTLCSLLGAKTVSVQVVEDTRTQLSWRAESHGGKGPIDASGQVNYQNLERFAGHLQWNDVFVGGEMDLARANDYLRMCGLDGDPEVRSLIEARSHPGNLLASRTVTVDLNRESERTMEAALSIKAPMVASLGATFARAAKSNGHYKVTFEVTFHEDAGA